MTMKLITSTLCAVLATTCFALADASGLTTTYQPLDGLDVGRIEITKVTCRDGYAASGTPTAIGLISVPNVPPTNEPNAKENLNLASACGLQFIYFDNEAIVEVRLDAHAFAIPTRFDDYSREDILRASLECLRLCLPDSLRAKPLILQAKEADKAWMGKIVAEFNKHNRRKVFFTPKSE